MRKLLLILAATACVGVANADVAIIDYQGYSWETGGFPPSDAGDVLNIVAVVDALDPIFGLDLGTTEVTVYVTGLVSQGGVLSNGVLTVSFTGGTISLYDDATTQHDYGVDPPNGTAPSTFVDGSLLLGGTFDNFFLYFEPSSGQGAFEGNVTFDSGSGLAALNQMQAPGYTFGGVLDTNASGGNVVQGYDLQVDGTLQVASRIAVEQKSWTGIKNLYRH